MLRNAYGRGGMLAVRPTTAQGCASCTSRDCVLARNRSRWDARSCPSLLNPAKLESNAECLVCGQCLKSCQPDNMGLLLRPPFSAKDSRERLASWPLTLFVMLVSGFVTSELAAEWPKAQEMFLWLSQRFSAAIGVQAGKGWLNGWWILFVFPALTWTLLAFIVKFFDGNWRLVEIWRRLALPMAAVISFAHMTKAVIKFDSWADFLPLALKNPQGMDTAQKITSGLLSSPQPIVGIGSVSILGTVLILLGLLFGIREFRLAQGKSSLTWRVPKLAFAGIYLLIVIGLGLSTFG